MLDILCRKNVTNVVRPLYKQKSFNMSWLFDEWNRKKEGTTDDAWKYDSVTALLEKLTY